MRLLSTVMTSHLWPPWGRRDLSTIPTAVPALDKDHSLRWGSSTGVSFVEKGECVMESVWWSAKGPDECEWVVGEVKWEVCECVAKGACEVEGENGDKREQKIETVVLHMKRSLIYNNLATHFLLLLWIRTLSWTLSRTNWTTHITHRHYFPKLHSSIGFQEKATQ